jgi:hypothetical protein
MSEEQVEQLPSNKSEISPEIAQPSLPTVDSSKPSELQDDKSKDTTSKPTDLSSTDELEILEGALARLNDPEDAEIRDKLVKLIHPAREQESQLQLKRSELELQAYKIEVDERESNYYIQRELKALELEELRLKIRRQKEKDALDLLYLKETQLDIYHRERRAYELEIRTRLHSIYAKLAMGFSAFGLGAYLTFSGNLFGAFPMAAGFASVGIPMRQAIELIRVLRGGSSSQRNISESKSENSDGEGTDAI